MFLLAGLNIYMSLTQATACAVGQYNSLYVSLRMVALYSIQGFCFDTVKVQ